MLIRTVGPKTATTLIQFANGVDSRLLSVVSELKSVSIQLSYGVRCSNRSDVLRYLQSLCSLLADKAAARKVQGSKLVLKLYKKIAGSTTVKHLGHGPVDILRFSLSFRILDSSTYSSSLIPSDKLLEHAISLWESLHVAPEDVRGFGLTLRSLSSESSATPIRDFFNAQSRSASSPHRKKKAAARKEESAIARLLNEHRSHPLPETPMIDLPPLASLDLDVFQMLPRGLQEEMLRSYVEKGSEIPARFEGLFRRFAEVEEEKRVFVGFVENLMTPMMDKERFFAVKQYVDAYELNREAMEGICVCVLYILFQYCRNWQKRE